MHKELVILVDALEEASIKCLQDSALLTFGYLAALHAEQNPDGFSIGLCAVHRQANGRDVQLKVLKRPGPFSLRDFHFAAQKLHAAATPGSADPQKTGLALKSLIAHLASRKGLPAPVQTTVCLLGHIFSHEAFRRAIADASRTSIRLQFVALVPTVDLGGMCMSDADRTTFLAELADADNATADFVPNDPVSLQQVALRWVREFALSPPQRVTLQLPTSLLHCSLLSQVLPLDVHLAPGQLCACHRAPLADLGPSGLAGSCSVSGSALRQQDVVPDAQAAELGRSTRLAFPLGAVMPPLRVPQPSSADAPAAAADMVSVRSVRQVKLEELSEGLMWGRPHLLAADGDALADYEAGEANDQAVAALCQVLRDSGSGLLLAAGANLDTAACGGGGASAAAASPFTCYYAARPAADCATLLIRRIASAEELLPVMTALPPPCEPSEEALRAAQAQLAGLAAPAAGGLFSPLDHSSGAFSLLRPLLQASVPAAPRSPIPAPAATMAAAVATGQMQLRPPADQDVGRGQAQLQQQEAGQAAAMLPRGSGGGGGDGGGATGGHPAAGAAAHHAAQLGGRLQRLRLPDCSSGADTAAAGVPAGDAQLHCSGGRGKPPAAALEAAHGGRPPLAARQPAGRLASGDGGRRTAASAEMMEGGDGDGDAWPGGGQQRQQQQQPQQAGGVTRFNVGPPQLRGRGAGGKGRQRSSGGLSKGGLPLKRLRKAAP